MGRKRKGAEARLLTPEERKFAHLYAENGNVALSSREAGISHPKGYRLVKDPNVQAFVGALQREAASEHNLTRAKVIHGLMKETMGTTHGGRVAAWIALARIGGFMVEQHNIRGSIDVTHRAQVYLPDNGRGDYDGRTITLDRPALSPN